MTALGRWLGLLLVAALTLASACGGGAATAPASPSSSSVTTGTTANVCTARTPGEPQPITDPNGPFFHQTAVATTTDGRVMAGPLQILDHASVPDGTRLPDGSVGVYYVNGTDGAVWLARLVGGVATPVAPIAIDGVTRPAGAVDPDAVLLPNRRVRLVYLNGLGLSGSEERAICIADSTDGLQFQVVATAVRLGAGAPETDPSVTPLPDGSWLMAISRGQQTEIARSADGLTYSVFDTLSYGGVPELAALDDGRVRLYVCAGGIESYASADAGRTWQREGTVLPSGTLGHRIVCDPSRVAGTNLFLFKTGDQ